MRYSQNEWQKELENRFGKNRLDWAFVCPACGKVTTLREFKEAGAEPNDSYSNCIGRFNGKGKPYLNAKEGTQFVNGCDWSACGLFGTLGGGDIVVTDMGKEIQVFSMAKEDRKVEANNE